MRRRTACLALALALSGAAPATAHPSYLPPFLDRVPEVGDRWLYQSEEIEAFWRVEVIEVSEEPDGWRCVVESQVDPAPALRVEWLLRDDGSIGRGDDWWRGEHFERKKPLLVIAAPPPSHEPVRFGHVAWRGNGKRRGWMGIAFGLLQPHLPLQRPFWLRLGEKDRPTLYVVYDPDLGRVRWIDRRAWDWQLVSAVVGGVAWER